VDGESLVVLDLHGRHLVRLVLEACHDEEADNTILFFAHGPKPKLIPVFVACMELCPECVVLGLQVDLECLGGADDDGCSWTV